MGMDIETKDLLELYYYLKLTRSLEDRITNLYRQGRIVGGVYTSNGQEAISVGYAYALEKNDIAAPYHRDMGAFLVRGITPKRIIAQYLGKRDGPTKGKDGNVHVGDLSLGVICFVSHLADNLPVAAGIALSFKLRGEKRVVATNTGDGATSRGDFYEAVNLAAVHKLPVVFFCNNNQYAYSTPLRLQMAVKDVAERASGYGIPTEIVDGNDLVAVYKSAKNAYARAREGGGPAFIECKTMRMHGHSEHDDAKYVPKSLLEEWRAKDPILRMEGYLLGNNLADDKGLKDLGEKIRTEIEEATEFAEKSPYPEGSEALEGVYANPIEEEAKVHEGGNLSGGNITRVA